MNQKIEWYKEVLALEPGSKVFFPLARMQAENGMAEEALATLRQGLGRNPEHIEARLLLIDILFGLKQFDALWPELDQIALMLGGYPGFWSAWNTRLARNPSSKDASLALSFFSATLRGEAVSWTDVIENGLRALLAGGHEGAGKEGASRVARVAPVKPAELNELHSYLGKSSESASRTAKSAPAVVLEALSGEPSAEAEADDDEAALPDALEAEIEGDAESEDEAISLKTRSMAEVLAEQGDYAGALDIYEELLREAESAAEKQSLEAAIAAVSARAGDNISASGPGGSGEGSGQDDAALPPGQGKNRLMDVLEALAQRLEARG